MNKKCTFVKKFKLAIVKPLFKSGCRDNVSNYNPISTLCHFSKIFEKIVKTRLIFFLKSNEL